VPELSKQAYSRAVKPMAKPRASPGAGGTAKRPNSNPAPAAPYFWNQKTLEELNPAEWESLCDGCGRCCLVKLEDADSGAVYFTDIGCKLFDASACRCTDYARRQKKVHDCIRLTPAKVRTLSWLPPSCAYRLVAEGRDLPWWHPLISGTRASVHEAGVSVRNRVSLREDEVEAAGLARKTALWDPPQRPCRARREVRGPRGHCRIADFLLIYIKII
jgi:uncharacterized protein